MPHPDRIENLTHLVFRAFTSSIFLVAGIQHLVSPDDVASRLIAAPLGHLATAIADPRTLMVGMGVVLVAGGLALLLGSFTRMAALALAACLIPITISVQVGSAATLGPLFKNVAIMGALVRLAVSGGGAWSLDALRSGRARRVARPALTGLSIVIALAATSALAKAPAPSPADAKVDAARVLFLVQQPPQLDAALKTGVELLSGRHLPAREVEIVVCGPATEQLLLDAKAAPAVDAAAAKGIRVMACGLTLTQKGIDPARLNPKVTPVENGLVEVLQRKAEGFLSVEL